MSCAKVCPSAVQPPEGKADAGAILSYHAFPSICPAPGHCSNDQDPGGCVHSAHRIATRKKMLGVKVFDISHNPELAGVIPEQVIVDWAALALQMLLFLYLTHCTRRECRVFLVAST